MHNYLFSMPNGYPEYILKPYSGLLIQKVKDKEQVIMQYKFDEHYGESYPLDRFEQYSIEDDYFMMLFAMPLGDGEDDIKGLYSLGQYNIDMTFYNNVARYLVDFMNEYNVYLLDIKLQNMVSIGGQLKFIDLDLICKVKDNINDKDIKRSAKGYYNSLPDCNALKCATDCGRWSYLAPEMRKKEWNINPDTTLTWNIGYMVYTDLQVIYRGCENIMTKKGRLHSLSSDKNYMRNIRKLLDTEIPTLYSYNEMEQQLIQQKQALLALIVPLPDSDDETWETGEIYRNWDPNMRQPLSLLIDVSF